MAAVSDLTPWAEVLEAGRADGRLVATRFEGRRRALVEPVPALHPDLVAALAQRGVDGLWRHQDQALRAALEGDVVVTTGTASGKSLCFNLPTLNHLLQRPTARALYLYPTKALTHDQARSLHAFGLHRRVRPAVYDGDTPREDRAQIRRRANVILTNPDMLHVGMLPRHHAWGDLLANLDVIVVDEAHVYRGVFGSHVANVLRRLLRIASAYGSEPRVLLATATIANPIELAQRLTGRGDFALVDEDGSPGHPREIAMWNPPLEDEALGTRRSSFSEAADLLADLVSQGARTICFMKSRRGVELLAKLVRDGLDARDPTLHDDLVQPYRAGYTAAQRRDIEERLVRGDVRCVLATNALELGIDIGALDAAVVVTFPGTVASLRQMWGRAGRRGRGLAVYVAGEDALDQFFCRHPDQFLDRAVEAAILDHASPEILDGHLRCAAQEGPLDDADATAAFGPAWRDGAERLVARGQLRRRPDGTFVPSDPGAYPAGDVALRSSSFDAFAVVDVEGGELLGTVEASRAFSTVHDGAVYLHQARQYEVAELDVKGRRALVKPFGERWYTQPKTETLTAVERLEQRREALGVTLSFGRVAVTETVVAYARKQLPGHEQIDLVALDLPETTFSTQALWYEVPDELLGVDWKLDGLLGALHAAEHSQIAVLPLLAMCDRWDIGGLSTNAHPQTGGPAIFIYDGHPGGIGIARRGFEAFETLVADAHRLIAECPCESGCPSCVQSPKCGNLNEPLSKRGALELMERMLARA